jgi:hypothetical protein
VPGISLTDLKAHLGITSNRDDGELQEMLDAAEAWTSRHIGLPVGAATHDFRVYSDSTQLLLPATGLSGDVTVTDPTGAAVTGASVDLAAGIVRVPYRRSGTWTVTLTRPAGTGLEPDLRLAVLIIAAHLWETQRGPAPAGPLADPDAVPAFGAGFAIPNRAQDLLSGFRLPATA